MRFRTSNLLFGDGCVLAVTRPCTRSLVNDKWVFCGERMSHLENSRRG